ncbi:hypothetical protein CYY_001988 [Polysphondylium violaceum]|uniref:Uncharacterized protein n=1 Tax=Polysphondylium violaceum TaxID=133409 RepID=A0A8J4PZ85_9MYCE|nr:hypothetical protein CYY_001988 [Polysphondylium violaceum]
MNQNSKFLLRVFEKAKDFTSISQIPRVPTTYSLNGLEAISHPKDFTLRASLTKRNSLVVAEDQETKKAIGSYGCNIKDMRLFGKKKTIFYAFDFNVHPDYRNQQIGGLMVRDLDNNIKKEHMKTPANEPLLFTSTSKENVSAKKMVNGIDLNHYCDQKQCAWKVDQLLPLPQLQWEQLTIHITEEKNSRIIKNKWEKAFGEYNFIPDNFDDLLTFNKKYHETTYIAQLRKGNVVISEASISLWNQDLLFQIQNTTSATTQKHRQLYSCYSMGFEKDFTFDYLLTYVHNQQFKRGINYLFAGFAGTDPIIKHFPLIPGIKDIEFSAYLRVNNKEERTLLERAIDAQTPIYNCPRDYGSVHFYTADNSTENYDNNNVEKFQSQKKMMTLYQ